MSRVHFVSETAQVELKSGTSVSPWRQAVLLLDEPTSGLDPVQAGWCGRTSTLPTLNHLLLLLLCASVLRCSAPGLNCN